MNNLRKTYMVIFLKIIPLSLLPILLASPGTSYNLDFQSAAYTAGLLKYYNIDYDPFAPFQTSDVSHPESLD